MMLLDEWKSIITSVIINDKISLNKCQVSGSFTVIPNQVVKSNPKKLGSYFCPNIIIWDPLEAATSNGETAAFCPDHICKLISLNEYMDGDNSSREPRLCIDDNGISLIVGRNYDCELGNHKIRTTDPKLIPQCERYSREILFSHKAAARIEFLTSLVLKISNGITFSQIKEQLLMKVLDRFELSKHQYILDCLGSKIDLNETQLENIRQKLVNMIPSVNLIEDLFKSWFNRYENTFKDVMYNIPAKVLTVDHTFKVTTNIGAYRTGDEKKWVKLYNSLFIVMNEHKQVVSWHFTYNEKFSFVESLLKCVKDFGKIELIILDNCCKWENKIRSVLGNDIKIKLDPFHAIQRITSTIRKNHPFHKNMVGELQGIFRSEFDTGLKRKESTVSSEIILRRLNSIVEKWSKLEYLTLGMSLITSETRKAIACLKMHISKGCLSGIPAGQTTSNNENLHRCLNKVTKYRSMGPELAYALFSSFFYFWNEKRGNMEHHVAKSILSLDILRNSSLKFGIGGIPQQQQQLSNKWVRNRSSPHQSNVIDKLYIFRHFKLYFSQKLNMKMCSSESIIDKIIKAVISNNPEEVHVPKPVLNLEEMPCFILETDIHNLLSSLCHVITNFVKENKNIGNKKSAFFNEQLKESYHQNLQILWQFFDQDYLETIHKVVDFTGVTVVLVTSLSEAPILPVYSKNPYCNMYWVYIQLTSKGFFPLIKKPNLSERKSNPKFTCSCGKKRKNQDEKPSCVSNFDYKCRCPCFRVGKSCENCSCHQCGNPYGKNKLKVEEKCRKRSKPQLSTRRQVSLDFLCSKDEPPVSGTWSDIEIMLLECIEEKGIKNINEMLSLFNEEALKLAYLGFQIDLKTHNQIRSKVVSKESTSLYFMGWLHTLCG